MIPQSDQEAADAFVEAALKAALLAEAVDWPVFDGMAPDGYVLNDGEGYVIFGSSSSIDTETNGDVRVMAQFPYTVRALAKGNVSSTAPIQSLIDSALHGVRQAVVGSYIVNSKRTGALSSLSSQMGLKYRQAGGRYLVTVRTRS